MRETALVTDVILSMFLLGVVRVELEVLMFFVKSRHPDPHTTVLQMVTIEVMIFLEFSCLLQHHQDSCTKNANTKELFDA